MSDCFIEILSILSGEEGRGSTQAERGKKERGKGDFGQEWLQRQQKPTSSSSLSLFFSLEGQEALFFLSFDSLLHTKGEE